MKTKLVSDQLSDVEKVSLMFWREKKPDPCILKTGKVPKASLCDLIFILQFMKGLYQVYSNSTNLTNIYFYIINKNLKIRLEDI